MSPPAQSPARGPMAYPHRSHCTGPHPQNGNHPGSNLHQFLRRRISLPLASGALVGRESTDSFLISRAILCTIVIFLTSIARDEGFRWHSKPRSKMTSGRSVNSPDVVAKTSFRAGIAIELASERCQNYSILPDSEGRSPGSTYQIY